VLAGLTALCALLVWRAPAPSPTSAGREHVRPEAPAGPPPTAWRRLIRVALAFVPSSQMLGVTTYITTDVAAIPLLWVLPLANYLLCLTANILFPGCFILFPTAFRY
jgi:hypothetical protein